MSAKAIKLILANAPELRTLTEQSRRLLYLQQLVQSILPAGLVSQVTVGGLTSGTLTLIATSGAVAAKLRQLQPRLLKHLQRDEGELNSLRIVVQVSPRYNPLRKKKIFLSHTTQDALVALASRLESPSLRAAVLKLSTRATTSNNKQETLDEIDPYKNQQDKPADS